MRSTWDKLKPQPYKPMNGGEYCPEMTSNLKIASRLCYQHPNKCMQCDLLKDKYCNWGIQAVRRYKNGEAEYFDQFQVIHRETPKKPDGSICRKHALKNITIEMARDVVGQEKPALYLMQKYGYQQSSAYRTVRRMRKMLEGSV